VEADSIGEPYDEPRTNQRLNVAQAAAQLGITEGAVRSRIKRGTLPTVKEAGRVFVVWAGVDGGTSTANHAPNTGDSKAAPDQRELVEELRDRVRALEETNRENRRIIAGLIQRVPELESPRDEPHGPETVTDEPSSTSASEAPPGRETASSQGPERRPSWWRRFFGFE